MNKLNRLFLLTLFILILVVIVLSANLVKKNNDENVSRSSNSPILINFDKNDFGKIDDFIEKFKEGKSSYLMLIPPTIDSGFLIDDVYSDGKIVNWTIDSSRDALSSKKSVNYSCQQIDKIETVESYTVVLSSCKNYDPNEKLKIFSISKKD